MPADMGSVVDMRQAQNFSRATNIRARKFPTIATLHEGVRAAPFGKLL